MKRILFICGQNRWRSPTAEHVFAEYSGLECASAGLNHDADNPVTSELVEWADIIFVMEREHKAKLTSRFNAQLGSKRIVSLGIPDKYKFMDPALVELLKSKVTHLLT